MLSTARSARPLVTWAGGLLRAGAARITAAETFAPRARAAARTRRLMRVCSRTTRKGQHPRSRRHRRRVTTQRGASDASSGSDAPARTPRVGLGVYMTMRAANLMKMIDRGESQAGILRELDMWPLLPVLQVLSVLQ